MIDSRILFVFVLCALMPTQATGQSNPIRIYTVLPQPATPRSFKALTDVRMDVDPGSWEPGPSFQVRAFRGTKMDLPGLGRATPDDCLEYDTSVYSPSPPRRGQVLIAQTDRSWLSVSPEKRYISGHWVLIFESGAPKDLRIKIARKDAEAYFSRGIEIEVEPDTELYLPERVEREVRDHRRQYDHLVRAVTTNASGCMELVQAGPQARTYLRESCAEQLAAAQDDDGKSEIRRFHGASRRLLLWWSGRRGHAGN